MSRILAIEPDSERAKTLKRLVSEWVDADVVVAESTDAAIASMAEQGPDLILTSVLISPSDDEYLTAHLRQMPDGQHLQVLTVPPLVDPVEASRLKKRGLFSIFRRKKPALWPAYDHQALGARIKEALEESRSAGVRSQILSGSASRGPER